MIRTTFSTKSIVKDLLIGVLIAAVSIPISMGYAMVAGLPAIYGLYGSFLPILLYGLFTSSPRIVFGVDAAPAALTGALLLSLGIESGSEDAVSIMPMITILTAAWLFLLFFFSADRLMRFISQPVMGGFITGIGLTIILMQIPKLYGGTAGTGEMPELVKHIIDTAGERFHVLSFLLGVGTTALIILSKRFFPKLPMQAILMVAGAVLAAVFGLEDKGVAMLPSVKAGLPEFRLPDFEYLEIDPRTILLSTFSIAVVILSETLLATGHYALKYEDRLRHRREALAYSVGNAAAAVSGCCPVNGSISRSGIADQFGVRSQWMSVAAGVSMLLILLFGTPLISYLPVPVLTGIVIAALIGTLEFGLAGRLRRVDRSEHLIFWAALAAVLLMGTIYGVIVGVLLSSITFIVRQTRPKIEILGVDPEEEGFHSLKRKGNYAPIHGVLLYRFSGALFFANINDFEEGLKAAISPGVKVIVIDAAGIGSVDVTAAERLLHLYHKFKEQNIRFYLAGHVSAVNAELIAFGAEELVEAGAVCSRISLALRDAGYEKPYILDPRPEQSKKSTTHHQSERSWAYGEDTEDRHMEYLKKRSRELKKPRNKF